MAHVTPRQKTQQFTRNGEKGTHQTYEDHQVSTSLASVESGVEKAILSRERQNIPSVITDHVLCKRKKATVYHRYRYHSSERKDTFHIALVGQAETT